MPEVWDLEEGGRAVAAGYTREGFSEGDDLDGGFGGFSFSPSSPSSSSSLYDRPKFRVWSAVSNSVLIS